MNQKWIPFLATFFYVGKIPRAPGTFGTLAAIPLWYILSHYLQPLPYMMLVFALVVGAMVICEMYERQVQTHDNSEVVIDEVVGFLITMTWVPENWKSVVAGFLLFRFFDIAKPFPISYLDKRVRGGVGVVIDDVAAGILASVILQGIYSYGLLS